VQFRHSEPVQQTFKKLPNLNTAVCNTLSQQAQTDLQILWATWLPVLRNYTRCNSDDAVTLRCAVYCRHFFHSEMQKKKLISKTQDNQRSQESSRPIRNYYHLWLLTYVHKDKLQTSMPISG
jgi:isocitrate dehydrogenase kinase/phosphatase